MMISPWRSTKWRGASFQPSEPNTYGSPTSSASASAQSAPCNAPSVNEAPIRMLVPSRVPTASPLAERCRPGSPRPALYKRITCPIRTTKYAHANSRPRSPNASGTHNATTSRAAIAPKIAKRTIPSSGSTTLVSHE